MATAIEYGLIAQQIPQAIVAWPNPYTPTGIEELLRAYQVERTLQPVYAPTTAPQST